MIRKAVFVLFFLYSTVRGSMWAQCAMCKAVAEDKALESGGSTINTAIIYIMFIPYVLIAGALFFAFRKKILPFFKEIRKMNG